MDFSQGLTLRWWEYPLIVLLTAFVQYVISFVGEKGKNFATKSDVQLIESQVRTLTKAEEEVRAQITGGLSLAQREWEQKRDVYTLILQQLGEAARMYERAFTLDFLTPYPSEESDQRLRDERLERLYSAGCNALDTGLANRVLADIWLPEAAVAVLDRFIETLNATVAEPSHVRSSRLDAELHAIQVAYRGLLDVARRDMKALSPPSATPEPRG